MTETPDWRVEGDRVVNLLGEVAMTYRHAQRSLWRGRIVFALRHGIALAWVRPEDVVELLRYRGGCCGSKQQMYFLASESQVRLWTTGRAR